PPNSGEGWGGGSAKAKRTSSSETPKALPVQMASPAVALLRLAEELVAVLRDERVAELGELADAGNIVDVRDPANEAERAEQPRDRGGAVVDAAVGRDDVQLLHARVVGDARKSLEHAFILEVGRLHDRRPDHARELLRALRAEAAMPVVEHHELRTAR